MRFSFPNKLGALALALAFALAAATLWASPASETMAAEVEMVTVELTRTDGTTMSIEVEKPRYGGWATEAVLGGTTTDPTGPSHLAWPSQPPYDRLVVVDWARGVSGTGEFSTPGDVPQVWWIGDAAESFEQTGPTHVVFQIRRGIHFWDKENVVNPVPELESAYGREANAHDVVYSANSQKENPASGAWPNFTWTARDDWTVDVDWAGHGADYTWENFRLLGNMTLRPVEAEGVDMVDWRNALGTGPFIWSNYVDGSVAEYVKNPNYWGTDPLFPENQQPYLDGFRMIPFAEIEAVGAGMRTGQIDRNGSLFAFLPERWQESLAETNPELNSRVGQWRQAIFHMRQDLPGSKFADMRVRQAFMLAIPHQEVNDQFYAGNGLTYAWPAYPTTGAFFVPLEDLPTEPLLAHEGSGTSAQSLIGRDLDKARKLLADAGYPDGFEFEVITPPEFQHFTELYSGYWDDIGLIANINVQESGVYSTIMVNGEHQEMVANDWGNGPSAFSTLVHYYDINSSWNYSRAATPVYDQFRAEIAGLPPAEGIARYNEYFVYALERSDTIPVVAEPTFLFWQPWIKGYNGEKGVAVDRWLALSRFYWVDTDMKQQMSGRGPNE